jgi:hypothetical protein
MPLRARQRHEHAVGIRPDMGPGTEDDAGDLHGNVELADASLALLRGFEPRALTPEIERPDRNPVADRAVRR